MTIHSYARHSQWQHVEALCERHLKQTYINDTTLQMYHALSLHLQAKHTDAIKQLVELTNDQTMALGALCALCLAYKAAASDKHALQLFSDRFQAESDSTAAPAKVTWVEVVRVSIAGALHLRPVLLLGRGA